MLQNSDHTASPESRAWFAGSPGADVWSTFSTSRDAAPAAPDVFGADPFGAAPAAPSGMDLFGAAPAAPARPSASHTAAFSASADPFAARPSASPVAAAPAGRDPFAMGSSDFGGSAFGSGSAASGSGSAAADPFGMSSLTAGPSKTPAAAPTTPPARALPEDMFAAPAAPAFGMGGVRPPQQQQQQGFGQIPFGQAGFAGATGGYGSPHASAFPAGQQAAGPFGMPQQANAFGGHSLQGGFGGPQAGFGGQQAAFGGQSGGFGAGSDPFGSDNGFGSSFVQVFTVSWILQ